MEERKSKKIVVDFIELLKVIGKDKLMMAVFLGIAAVLGLAVAFGTPKEYKASVMLAPESTTGNSLTSNISSIASMVGMDMDFGSSSDAIYPELYPDLIGSNDFIVSLFPVEVTTKDGSVTTDYYDYLLNHTKKAWYTFPARLLHDIVAKLKTDDVPFTGDSTKVNPFHLSKMQYNIAHKIGKSINCTVDKKTSVITIEVTDQDPVVCATVADSVRKRLQVAMTDYRTTKARHDLEYIKHLHQESKKNYDRACSLYAEFMDSNQEVVLESVRQKQTRLENEMQLRYNNYNALSAQLLSAMARVQQDTPAFATLECATVPLGKEGPHRGRTAIAFVFIAFMAITLWVMYKEGEMKSLFKGLN